MDRPLVVAAILCFALAGCAQQGGKAVTQDSLDAAADDVEVEVTETTGAIRGVVVDDAIRPLGGVNVTLETPTGPVFTRTLASGGFGFSRLEPGTYFVTAHLFGYHDARQSVEVVAGVADPPAAKLQLTVIVGLLAYVEQFKWDGFVQCGTNNIILCAGPNAGSQLACALSKGQPPLGPPTPPFPTPVCMGNVTNDEFSIWIGVATNITLIQGEMVWDSTQALGDQLTLLLRYGSLDDFNAGFYNGSLNSSTGKSPVTARANAADMNETDLGTNNGLVLAIFPGRTTAVPGLPFGAVVQQAFTVFTFVFHGYLPPEDWTFVASNTVPQPG